MEIITTKYMKKQDVLNKPISALILGLEPITNRFGKSAINMEVIVKGNSALTDEVYTLEVFGLQLSNIVKKYGKESGNWVGKEIMISSYVFNVVNGNNLLSWKLE